MLCPGWYCGRILDENGVLSECGSCPRGFRRNDTTHICELCTLTPSFYDWMYLGFMVLLVLVLHWFFIDLVSMRRSFNKAVLTLHFTALLEVVLAATITILVSHPFGHFYINGCGVENLADWYTLLHNPTPNYGPAVHCTQEAVYPLYTMVLIFYGLALLLMLLIRPWICQKILPLQSKMSIYAAMYFIPILTVLHALCAGLLYYSYPVLVIVLSLISSATHFAVKINQSITSLVVTTLVDHRNIVILLGHWCLHAYGIIAITQLSEPLFHGLLTLLVPLPAAFYILTARFTDPSKF